MEMELNFKINIHYDDEISQYLYVDSSCDMCTT